MPTPHILVVEDDSAIAAGLVRGLRQAGFSVALAVDGAAAEAAAARERPDLIILDLNLPERDGFQLLTAWQSRHSAPVIVLTARTELGDRLRSFGLGAADYLPKPFWMEELLARVRTRLRITAADAPRTVCFAGVTVDLDGRQVRGEGASALTAHEFNVLAYLVERPGRALTRAQIADSALPPTGERTDRTVDSHIARIRKKLGPAGACIRTAWGVGYRFDPAEPAAPAAGDAGHASHEGEP